MLFSLQCLLRALHQEWSARRKMFGGICAAADFFLFGSGTVGRAYGTARFYSSNPHSGTGAVFEFFLSFWREGIKSLLLGQCAWALESGPSPIACCCSASAAQLRAATAARKKRKGRASASRQREVRFFFCSLCLSLFLCATGARPCPMESSIPLSESQIPLIAQILTSLPPLPGSPSLLHLSVNPPPQLDLPSSDLCEYMLARAPFRGKIETSWAPLRKSLGSIGKEGTQGEEGTSLAGSSAQGASKKFASRH